MKRLGLLIILGLFLSGCVSTDNYYEYVYRKQSEGAIIRPDTIHPYIQFKADKLPQTDTLVQVKKVRTLFVPALLYWQWEGTKKCELNARKYADVFFAKFQFYADSLDLKPQLNGQRLEITMENIPHCFFYMEKGYIVFLFYTSITNDLEAIYPQREELGFSYRLYSGDVVTQSGFIEIERFDEFMENQSWSTKKFTWQYLEQYEQSIVDLSKAAVERLITQLKLAEAKKE